MIYGDIQWKTDDDQIVQITRQLPGTTLVTIVGGHFTKNQWSKTADLDEVVNELDGAYERVEQPLPYRVHAWSVNDVTLIDAHFYAADDAFNAISGVLESDQDPLHWDITNVNTGEEFARSEDEAPDHR